MSLGFGPEDEAGLDQVLFDAVANRDIAGNLDLPVLTGNHLFHLRRQADFGGLAGVLRPGDGHFSGIHQLGAVVGGVLAGELPLGGEHRHHALRFVQATLRLDDRLGESRHPRVDDLRRRGRCGHQDSDGNQASILHGRELLGYALFYFERVVEKGQTYIIH